MCPDNNPKGSQPAIELIPGANGELATRGEVTDRLLRTDDQIISEWLTNIGLTRADVVELALSRRDSLTSRHGLQGGISQVEVDALTQEAQKLGLRSKGRSRIKNRG